jgi:hypothetical protein
MPVVVVEGQEPFTGFRPDKLQELKELKWYAASLYVYNW